MCDLSNYTKIMYYSVFLLFYLYYQDNNNYLLLNLIFNQIKILKK
jgi:hypothetical protein